MESASETGEDEKNGRNEKAERNGTGETSGTGGTSETSGTNLCQRGIDNYYQTFINKILIMNIETHYKKLITQLVPTCSCKKNLEYILFHY